MELNTPQQITYARSFVGYGKNYIKTEPTTENLESNNFQRHKII